MLSNLPWSGEVFVDMGGMFRAIYILYAKQKKIDFLWGWFLIGYSFGTPKFMVFISICVSNRRFG